MRNKGTQSLPFVASIAFRLRKTIIQRAYNTDGRSVDRVFAAQSIDDVVSDSFNEIGGSIMGITADWWAVPAESQYFY